MLDHAAVARPVSHSRYAAYRINPCRVRDWKGNFDPTLTTREPSLVLVSKFCKYRKA